MTTAIRARWTFAAAVIALVGGPLAVSAEPAAAAAPSIVIERLSSDNVKSGETVRVRFRVTNNERGTQRAFVVVGGGLRCTAGCSATRDFGPGRGASFDATLVAPQVSANEQSGRNLSVAVRMGAENAFANKLIMVRGSDQAPGGDKPAAGVSQVSGRVVDADGKAVGGAAVTVRDSTGHEYRTTSNGDGRFSLRSSAGKPIAAGSISVAAVKDGYRAFRTKVRGAAGGAATVRLTLAAVPAASTPPPSPSVVASSPAVAEVPVTEESSAGAPLGTLKNVSDQGDGPLLFSILGGLLVAVGLGALVMMLIRRRGQDEPGEPAPAAPVTVSMADAQTAVLRAVPPDGGF
ncbi:carboxypeptidase-like regulatory domain-containing protein [Actinoplanes sp. NPDC049265]|uniref:carboxypeptidase-like regulatory domain-containing protein n=1 Tax=Actinoplanes sp. NPDC049265 TaxID=3363902 RepID=UPI003717F38D